MAATLMSFAAIINLIWGDTDRVFWKNELVGATPDQLNITEVDGKKSVWPNGPLAIQPNKRSTFPYTGGIIYAKVADCARSDRGRNLYYFGPKLGSWEKFADGFYVSVRGKLLMPYEYTPQCVLPCGLIAAKLEGRDTVVLLQILYYAEMNMYYCEARVTTVPYAANTLWDNFGIPTALTPELELGPNWCKYAEIDLDK